MPNNLYLSQKRYAQQFVGVAATAEGLRSPRMLTVDTTKVALDSNNQKILPPGTIMVKRADGLGVPLARTLTAEPVDTSEAAIDVSDAGHFAAGDVIIVPVPYASITFGGTYANNDTATLTISGQSAIHTALTAHLGSLTDLAAAAKATFEGRLGHLISILQDGATLYILSKTGQNHTIAVAETAAAGTLTIGGSVTSLQSNTLVGTIAANGVNNVSTPEVLTLASNSAVALPIGMPIGVGGGVIWGMTLRAIDLLETSDDVACYTSGSVYGDRLPYWDASVQAALPEITLV